MKIGMITSYLPLHCGIATYSSYLIEELRKLGHRVFIVCHKGGKGFDCYPAFNYDDPDLAHKAIKTMMKLTPDVVHIQHEYGLFGEQRGMSAIPLVFKLKLSHVPTVITLHTVLPQCNYQEQIIEKALVEVAEAIIVHEQYQKELLRRRVGLDDKIWVIPHGVRTISPTPRAKEKLGLKSQKIILLIGYFRKSKNFERVVNIYPQVAQAVKSSLLLIASGARRPEDIHYQEEFLELVAKSRAKDRIKVMLGPFTQQKFDLILSAADVVVLPYLKGAQSGIMAHCHAMAKPMVVTSDVKAMADLAQKFKTGLVARTNSELVEAIIHLITDNNLSQKLADNARKFVKNHVSWQIIASRHIDVYNKALTNGIVLKNRKL